MLKRFLPALLIAAAAAFVGGCESTVVPMRPMQTIEVDAPADDISATQPGATEEATTEATTQASTSPAPRVDLFNGQHGYTAVTFQRSFFTTPSSTEPAANAAVSTTTPAETQTASAASQPASAPASTMPTHKITRTIDPNQTTRLVYDADYNNVWQQAQQLLVYMNLRIDRHDYRLGIMTTVAQQSAEIIEPWRRDQAGGPMYALENTVNNQRRTIRLTISTIPGKPKFYQIAVQAMVERQSNPTEVLGGSIFSGTSGFGTNVITLRSDYTGTDKAGDYWTVIGRDPALEKKILDELFKHI